MRLNEVQRSTEWKEAHKNRVGFGRGKTLPIFLSREKKSGLNNIKKGTVLPGREKGRQ